MKNIAILGSTGSIGTNTLKIVESHPEKFRIVGLSAGKNVKLIARQIQKFRPKIVCLCDEKSSSCLKAQIGNRKNIEIVWGSNGIKNVATMPEADLIVSAISGSVGLLPTLLAIKSGKDVALANKESLVMAGSLLVEEAANSKAEIIPVDSEHSAIAQILHNRRLSEVKNIILTASGGPFLGHTKEQLSMVTPEEALRHPRWKMGKKVTIDSATLMNKGLEVIEARWLFNISTDRIKVVIHPQSIIHSIVEYVDGAMVAHLSHPDMKGPIAYALSYPERLPDTVKPLNITQMESLTFLEPDEERFPALKLAYDAIKIDGLMPAALNAANEIAVQKFLQGVIRFSSIPKIIEKVMDACRYSWKVTLENILWVDRWARKESEKVSTELKT